MNNASRPQAHGAVFLGVGASFLALGMLPATRPMLGAGLAFLVLGLVFLARARQ